MMIYAHKITYYKINEKLPVFHMLVLQITIICINQQEKGYNLVVDTCRN